MKRLICILLLCFVLLAFSACNITFQFPGDFWGGGDNVDENAVADMPENSFVINRGESDGDTVIHVITPEKEEETLPEEGEDESPAYSPAPDASFQPDQLIGEWVSATRHDDTIMSDWYYFNTDGTLSNCAGEYAHTSQYPELFAGYEKGWQPMPMGAPLIFGTYELQGNILIITYTGEEFYGDYDTPTIRKVEILSLAADRMVIANIDGYGSSEPQIYIRNNYLPIEELCDAVGVDTSFD